MSVLHPDYAPSIVRPSTAWLWVNLALCTLFGIAAAVLTIHASDTPKFDGFLLWAVSPFLGLGFIAFFVRHQQAGSVTVLVAILLGSALLVLEGYDFYTSKSSTAALTFLATPILQWGVALLGGIIAAVIAFCRRSGV